jgi:uncharacterized protein YkwD
MGRANSVSTAHQHKYFSIRTQQSNPILAQDQTVQHFRVGQNQVTTQDVHRGNKEVIQALEHLPVSTSPYFNSVFSIEPARRQLETNNPYLTGTIRYQCTKEQFNQTGHNRTRQASQRGKESNISTFSRN